jgi:hypothetical protein
MTRQGCAGQYSACFYNVSKYAGFGFEEYDLSRIHATQFDGNCVAIYGSPDSTTHIYKTMQCKERLPIVCIGKVFVEESMSQNIREVSNIDLHSYKFSSKSYNCKPDVIYRSCKKCSIIYLIFKLGSKNFKPYGET